MKIGYARVSTKEQHLDMQLEALKAAGCEKIFSEKMTGRQQNRPELDACLNFLREDRKSTRLNSSHMPKSRMPSSA